MKKITTLTDKSDHESTTKPSRGYQWFTAQPANIEIYGRFSKIRDIMTTEMSNELSNEQSDYKSFYNNKNPTADQETSTGISHLLFWLIRIIVLYFAINLLHIMIWFKT